MRFALLGSHPDGLEMACALVEAGGHQLIAYSSPSVPADYIRRWGPTARPVGDLEEVLADPAVEAVVVAGSPANRPYQLRRALQSERHVLCVHPADQSPDLGYEAAMIQGDTKCILLPLLPEALHPGVRRLAELLHDPEGPIGALQLIEMERRSPEAVLLDTGTAGYKPALPGWDVLRRLGGEIAEVFALTGGDEVIADKPLLLAGRFESGGLFQAALLPRQGQAHYRLTVIGNRGRAELLFPLGWPGPAFLSWTDPAGERQEEAWDVWDPWPALVEVFDQAANQKVLSWQDEVRCLELDDAARRSVERRRASALEYQEASEEVGFKGTMTLVGCGLLWGVLLLLVLSRWFPWLGWVIVPLLLVFLALQLLRWLVPRRSPPEPPPQGESRTASPAETEKRPRLDEAPRL
ncbi:MAG TPA: hypothetical protein VNK04_16650 [Gemmataceae bacterium]|nr:hypothetical protein [Gemmataceae bacterium]